jgi:signal transduction histidine kinase
VSWWRRLPLTRFVDGHARDLVVGLVLAVGATVLRYALVPVLSPDHVTYVVAFPAVAAAAMASGVVGGLTATLVSAILATNLLLPRLNASDFETVLSLAFFVAGGVLISVLGERFQASRALAEAARGRARLVADVSSLLAERTDTSTSVGALTNVVVPAFADWCAIDLFDEDGAFERAEIATLDAETATLAHRLRDRDPYSPNAPVGVAEVFRTGQPDIVLDVPRSLYDSIDDDELRATMQRLAIRSSISVPISGPSGRRFGVLTAVMSTSGRRFGADDVPTTIDIGRRIGAALDAAALLQDATGRADELAAIIESIDDPVLVAGASDRVRTMNRAARSQFGDAIGRPLEALLHDETRADAASGALQIVASGRFVRPVELRVPAGQVAPVRVLVLRDVTALLESESARDAFLAMLSHELRTPVTTIYGSSQVLQRPLPAETRGALLRDIGAESERLLRLVEDLLVLSRYERGRLVVNGEPLLMERVTAQLVRRIAESYPQLRVSLRAATDLPPVQADPTYVEQVVRNLLSNAVKYAGETAEVEIRVTHDGRSVVLEVEDDGPGIPDAERDRVFGLYERLGGSILKPGAGVGLFVCRRLVEAMDGSITVRRGGRGGACFAITLPAISIRDDAPARSPGTAGGNPSTDGWGSVGEDEARAIETTP